MSVTKKRKLSGLSGLELDITLTQLRKFHASMIFEAVPESDPTPDDPLPDQLKNFIAALESRVNDPFTLTFSAADDNFLERFNIVRKGVLRLHPEAKLRQAIDDSRTIGSEKLWSDDNMYNHLTYLGSSFTNKNETSTRIIIDTFFFRSTSMVPSPQKVVVMLENQVSAIYPRKSKMDTISGIIDYTAIVAESGIAEDYIDYPPTITRKYGDKMIAFFVAEAKHGPTGHGLEGHLPQVLLQLVACAKHLGKSHIRGAVTTGFTWVFVAVDLDDDGDGATYWISTSIQWVWDTKDREHKVSPTTTPALIAGILSSWIPESFVEFKGDQWFGLRGEVCEDVIGCL